MDISLREKLTAEQIKDKARALGAELVGIADGRAMDRHPPDPANPRRPADISGLDSERVIVLGLHVLGGTSRVPEWNSRHKFHNDELTLTALEEIALDLVYWLEGRGHTGLIVPHHMVEPVDPAADPTGYNPPLLSLDHAAVEAGLGTLGLNLQLVTPEYGPRVILTSVLTAAPVEADQPMDGALCQGPSCGRCLAACPADAVGHWERDFGACEKFKSPNGFPLAADFLERFAGEEDTDARRGILRSRDSFDLWQGIMRGAGVVVGCRRCQDVCPVGADYQAMIGDALETIAEDTPEKAARLKSMTAAEEQGTIAAGRTAAARWIGV
jgi:ferredoxin